MIDGSYRKQGLLHALGQLLKSPRTAARELKALLASNTERNFLYEQIERDRAALETKVQSLIGQLSDLTRIELLGAEKAFRLVRRFVNFCPFKVQNAKLGAPGQLDRQICDSE